jgi:hypothetical protein
MVVKVLKESPRSQVPAPLAATVGGVVTAVSAVPLALAARAAQQALTAMAGVAVMPVAAA